MNLRKTLTLALCVSFAASAAWAQCCGSKKCDDKPAAAKKKVDTKAAPAEQRSPAKPAVTTPALPKVVATVGKTEISGTKINNMLTNMPPNIPPAYVAQMRKRIMDQMVMQALVNNYTDTQKIEASKEEFGKIMAQIEDAAKKGGVTVKELMERAGMTEDDIKAQARTMEMVKQATTEAKIEKFVKDNPDYFNGTEVRASHILIRCQPTDATEKQKAAIAKLEKVAAEIKAGKISFADAANKYSECPSSQTKGKKELPGEFGDLGFFTFNKMLPPFSMAAFATKVGDMTGVVRTIYGFHLIKVTDRKAGKDPQASDAKQFAQAALESQLQNKVFNQALTTCPIVYNNEQPAANKVTTKKSAK